MLRPALANARLVAAPNPDDAPSTSAQPEILIGSASVVIVAVSLCGELREHSIIPVLP
jgi:hypothetical protein